MSATSTKANVLLVDDKPENLLALETVLASLGQNLISATSARQALKFLLLEDVALILLDVQMPGLDGFEFAELIRERERTQNTPIIFITANSDDEAFKFKGYALGAVDYLTKPIDPEILKSKVGFFTRLFVQQQQIVQQANELEAANERLDILNSELEERVKLRTLELERANCELASEVEERRVSEARLATDHAVTRTLASAGSIDEAVPGILRAFIDNIGAAVAAMWQPSSDGSALRCTHIEAAEGERDATSSFVTESRRRLFPVGVGFPGHVWNVGSPVWLPNTLHGDQFPRAAAAAFAGLHSAAGFPVKIGEEFFGVVEFFTRGPIAHDAKLAGMLEAMGSEIAQFVQRKRIEDEREKLLQREKMLREEAERANRLKDDFLATVSHELRTPLNSILGWSQVLLLDHAADEKVRTALEAINRNALSQAQLIEDLLDASRLITGKMTLDLSPTDLAPVLDAAVDAVRPAAEAKAISLEIAVGSGPIAVTCDAARLQQMVWNLLANAVKFTPQGGRITVGYERDANNVKLIVSDTGIGISPDFLPFVFDRFRQQDSSSTRKHQGLGLGLAIVKHLAELHGGTVGAFSEGTGSGSTFTITLPGGFVGEPLPERETVTKPITVKVSRQLAGVKLLIVEDDPDTCDMMEFVLGRYGADVVTVNNAADALRSIGERLPDVMLADINMPGEDGYSLMGRVRGLPECSGIMAMAVTALARPEDAERAAAAGFHGHFTKPVDIPELVESIRKNLSDRPLQRQKHLAGN